jgi:DNA processing protein
MQLALLDRAAGGPARSVSPLLELGAYECLWAEPGASFRRLAERFRAHPDFLPSDFVDHERAAEMGRLVVDMLAGKGVERFGLRVHRAGEYPAKLRDARHPVELLYFQGWWNLVETPCVAVVGTREPSEEGKRETRALVERLVAGGFTVVSGLARGIDKEAHRTALDAGGRTVAVLGTPLSEAYPAENAGLQREIAEGFLVVSQVPVVRYSRQGWQENRSFFPERNATMSALTEATVIVEAGETSGTLYQARAALQQGRKLFILDRCFGDMRLSWPRRFEEQGAIRVREYGDIEQALAASDAD